MCDSANICVPYFVSGSVYLSALTHILIEYSYSLKQVILPSIYKWAYSGPGYSVGYKYSQDHIHSKTYSKNLTLNLQMTSSRDLNTIIQMHLKMRF